MASPKAPPLICANASLNGNEDTINNDELLNRGVRKQRKPQAKEEEATKAGKDGGRTSTYAKDS